MLYALEEFYKVERRLRREDETVSFEVVGGRNPVLISAPHSVSQTRDGALKQGEYRTGALAVTLAKALGCNAFYKTANLGDDANWDLESEYKTALIDYIQTTGVRHMLDLHIMASHRSHVVEIGTFHGRNVQGDHAKVARIREILSMHIPGVILTDDRFIASERTVCATVASATGVFSVQLEINWSVLEGEFLDRSMLALETVVEYLMGE